MVCINRSHQDFLNLQQVTGLNPDVLNAMISIWMEENKTDSFPSLDELGLEQKQDDFPELFEKPDGLFDSNEKDDFFGVTKTWEHDTTNDVTKKLPKNVIGYLKGKPLNFKAGQKEKFDELVKVVGYEEAFIDYVQQKNQVRNPETVLGKLLYGSNVEFEGTSDTMFQRIPEDEVVDDITAVDQIKTIIESENKSKAVTAMTKLSDQLGINYEVITQEEFKDLYPDQPKTAGFYKKGKVYFIDGLFNYDTVLHEFSHPIIKSLSKDNPVLFETLYSNLLKSPEGSEIFDYVSKYYDELTPNSNLFMEEVLVQAMERLNSKPELKETSFFKDLLFQIKQFLRSIFGKKINVSKLDNNTTLQDFLNMLNQGEQFVLNMDFLNANDVVMFQRKYAEEIESVIQKNAMETTQQVIDEFYSLVQKQVGNLTKENSIFNTLKSELSDDFNEGVLQIIRKNLNELSTRGTRPVKTLDKLNPLTEIDVLRHKVEMFVTTLAYVDEVFKKLNTKADTLSANNLSKADFKDLLALHMYVENWTKFYDDALDGYFNQYNLEDPIYKLFTNSRKKVSDLSSKVNSITTDVVFDEFYDHVKKINQPVEDEALSELNELKNAGLFSEYEKRYKEWYGLTTSENTELLALDRRADKESLERYWELKSKSFNSQSISKDQLKAVAGNILGDADSILLLMTGYSNSSDDIVGGFHSYISQFFNEITGNANAKQTELLKKVKDQLKNSSFKTKMHGEGGLGLAIGKRDFILNSRNPLSEKEREELLLLSTLQNRDSEEQQRYQYLSLAKRGYEESEEYVFASNFKHYRSDRDRLRNDIEAARLEYNLNPTPENKKKFNLIVKEFKNFENDYMNKDGLDEVYQFDGFMDGPIGEMGKEKVDEIFEKMRILTSNTMSDPADFSIDEELSSLWVELRQLYSMYDLNGNEKTDSYTDASGNLIETYDKSIAEVLNQYKESTRDFYEYSDIPMKFENSLNLFTEGLFASNLSDAEIKVAVEKWIKYNTTVNVTDDYFEERKTLIDQRQDILKDLTALNNSIVDVTDLYTKMYDILSKTKNDSGQYSGFQLTKEQQKTITSLAAEIDLHKDSYLQLSGLTGSDYKDYVILLEKDRVGVLSYDEQLRLNDYEDLLSKNLVSGYNIGIAEIQKLRAIDKKLREMTTTECTDDYIAAFNNIVFSNPTLLDAFSNEIEDNFGEDIQATNTFTQEHIENLLENLSFMEAMMQEDASFKEFFNNNHFSSDRVVYNSKGQSVGVAEKYIKSPAWNTTKPTELKYYKSKAVSTITLPNGEQLFTSGFIELDGTPRIPNMSYNSRALKPEFLREKIERDFIDPATGDLVLANIDNKGQWLPKTIEEGAVDNRYVDDSYKAMFENDLDLFKTMLIIKDHHLDNQLKLDVSQRTYISYPNVRKQGTERSLIGTLRRGEGIKGYPRNKITAIRNIFRAQADDIEEGIVESGQFGSKMDEPLTRPITGIYHLPANEVSTNILASIGLQSYSIEHYKAARKAMPFMQLFNRVLKENMQSPEIIKYREKLTSLRLMGNLSTSETRRLESIQNSIDKNLGGEETVLVDGKKILAVKYKKTYLKLMGFMQKHASILFFGKNTISSLTNYYGGKSLVYARATSKHYNLKDLGYTRGLSTKVVAKLMRSRYKKGAKDPLVQLVHVMDAVPDMMKKDAGSLGARTMWADLRAGTHRFTSRKYTGDSVAVHQFLAILKNKSFDLNGKMTPLYKAITLDSKGRLVTIPGVPNDFKIEYDSDGDIVLGEELKNIMNVHQRFLQKNIGATNDLNEPEAFRYIWAKSAFFILKFLPGIVTGMYGMRFSKQKGIYGASRKNFMTQSKEIGTYVGAMTGVFSIINSKKKINSSQKTALYSLLILLSINLALRLLRGSYLNRFDRNDDDKNDYTFTPGEEGTFTMLKNANKVPNLPISDAIVQRERTVRTGGTFDATEWLKMSALRVVNRVIKEHESTLPFVPWDPYNSGLVPATFNILTSGSVVGENNILKDIKDGAAALITNDVYEQDAGPLIWQKAGQNKAWNTFMKYNFNLDGKMIDPAYGLKTDYSFKQ